MSNDKNRVRCASQKTRLKVSKKHKKIQKADAAGGEKLKRLRFKNIRAGLFC